MATPCGGVRFSKKGDAGETSLLGGERVPKYDPRPEAYGTLDEASSVLGVARAIAEEPRIGEIILRVQKDLLAMGAEMAARVEYADMLGGRIADSHVAEIEAIIDELQDSVSLPDEFIRPGANALSAQIDVGRTVVRRAERRAAELKRDGLLDNPEIHKYLNRLADMLFTLARYAETRR